MKVTILECTLNEWIEQLEYINMLKAQALSDTVSKDIIERVERLERIVFGEENHETDKH